MAMNERANLESLLNALDASPRALRCDECGDWQISGKQGHVYADGDGWLIVVTTAESPRRWTNAKHRLRPFCRITQDGDDEGCLHLDRLPAPDHAHLIREAVGIRKKRTLSPTALEHARFALERARGHVKPASNGQAFVI